MENAKRKIHVDLKEITHKRLRVKVAIEGASIQKFVEKLVCDAVEDIQLDELETQAGPIENHRK